MSRSILVVAAHPDDEVLGMGATMARYAADGYEVHTLLMAEGATSRTRHREETDASAASELQACAQAAAKILGGVGVRFGEMPDNRMDGVELLEVVKVIEAEVARVLPEIVFTHHPCDLNVDHRIVSDAVLTACRPLPGSSVREVLAGEVPSATGWGAPRPGSSFTPSLWIDVSDQLETKMEALRAYASEMRPFPHARSYEALEALARWRGSQVGVPAAEAFEVLRILR